MEPSFMVKSKSEGFYHLIKLAGHAINFFNRAKDIPTRNDGWRIPDFYDTELLEKHGSAGCILHLIAHEMQHAVQVDETGSNKQRNLEFFSTAKPSEFSKYYRAKKEELDAEAAARFYGPKMLKAYYEEIGEPVDFNFDQDSIVDDTNKKEYNQIKDMYAFALKKELKNGK